MNEPQQPPQTEESLRLAEIAQFKIVERCRAALSAAESEYARLSMERHKWYGKVYCTDCGCKLPDVGKWTCHECTLKSQELMP